MAALFTTGSYSTYYFPHKVRPKGDPDANYYRAWRQPVTSLQWQAHIEGRRGLTLPPNMDDGTAQWFAIDLDIYGMDLSEWVRTIERRGLPLVIVRSKSGGAHCFGFCEASIPIADARRAAAALARQMGLPETTELFPVDRLHPQGINMPYLGYSSPIMREQVGIRSNGGEMSMLEFVRTCSGSA